MTNKAIDTRWRNKRPCIDTSNSARCGCALKQRMITLSRQPVEGLSVAFKISGKHRHPLPDNGEKRHSPKDSEKSPDPLPLDKLKEIAGRVKHLHPSDIFLFTSGWMKWGDAEYQKEYEKLIDEEIPDEFAQALKEARDAKTKEDFIGVLMTVLALNDTCKAETDYPIKYCPVDSIARVIDAYKGIC